MSTTYVTVGVKFDGTRCNASVFVGDKHPVCLTHADTLLDDIVSQVISDAPDGEVKFEVMLWDEEGYMTEGDCDQVYAWARRSRASS